MRPPCTAACSRRAASRAVRSRRGSMLAKFALFLGLLATAVLARADRRAELSASGATLLARGLRASPRCAGAAIALRRSRSTWSTASPGSRSIPGLNRLPDHTATATLVVLRAADRVGARRAPAARGGHRSGDPRRGPSRRATVSRSSSRGFARLRRRHPRPRGPPRTCPLYGTFFLFILVSNLIGLIPGFAPPTSNFNVHARRSA